MGEKLRLSTFPVVVNEPGGVFEKPALVELLKTAVERTASRGRFEGRSYKTVLALSPVIFTSNLLLPDDDALVRRLECISFSHGEKKGSKEKKMFQVEFKVDNHDLCRFHSLRSLGVFSAREIKNNPQFLDLPWKELANLLLKRAYTVVGRVMPVWLSGWSSTESLEELNSLTIERIRGFFQKEINQAYGKFKHMDNSSVRVYDGLGDLDDRVLAVLEGRLIPWLFMNRKGDKVYITQGVLDALKKDMGVNDSLKSIAEMLNWEFTNTTVRGQFKGWSIRVSLDDLTNFIFP